MKKQAGGGKKQAFRGNPNMVPSLLSGLHHAARAVRELRWDRLFQALDVVVRYFVPCEALTLYIVEEEGRYLRKVNTYLDTFPPNRRGPPVEAVSEATLEGNASTNAEPCGLPSQTRFTPDWAAREATTLLPLPGMPSMDDLAAGYIDWPPPSWEIAEGEEQHVGGPRVAKVHNVLAFPLRFGTPDGDPDDPFQDYASTDSNNVGADETVFGVLKLTNRLAGKPRSRKLRLERLVRGRWTNTEDMMRYKPFTDSDFKFAAAMSDLLREIYFAIDPLTFGSRVERSLDFPEGEDEPLNAPSLAGGRSRLTSRSILSGSRLLSGAACGGGLFGVLGSAFAKTAATRRRAAELPEIVLKPDLTVTSDSTESMRNAPGWIHKEWTEDDVEGIEAEREDASKRRIGGITLLATWRLREDAVLDPYTVICRFQLRVRRISHQRRQEFWRTVPPFFCIAPDEVTRQYCSFLTEYLSYGEEYIVSVRAGSADRWSEWSVASEPVLFVASPLRPEEVTIPLECTQVPVPPMVPFDNFRMQDRQLKFTWPAFKSFDPRTPLPVEYRIEAWQRIDEVGAAAEAQLRALAAATHGRMLMSDDPSPSTRPAWKETTKLIVSSVMSDAMVGRPIECIVDVRKTSLVPDSEVFFVVRARYLSLPGSAEWSEAALFTHEAVRIPIVVPVLPVPVTLCADEFRERPPQRTPPRGQEPKGELVVKWPFIHPATFCPSLEDGGWRHGPYVAVAPPGQDFPLPFRIQYRIVEGAEEKGAPPRWSPWREAGEHTFVLRSCGAPLEGGDDGGLSHGGTGGRRQPSQRSAGGMANRGEFLAGKRRRSLMPPPRATVLLASGMGLSGTPSGPEDDEAEDGEECREPVRDPMGLLNEDIALHVAGLTLDAEHGWLGLAQLRWVSCGVEANHSAFSSVCCTRVATLRGAPHADHLIVNCSSGNARGQGILDIEPAEEPEDVVHELRHVVRLTWNMDTREPSFAFLRSFAVRYQELPPTNPAGGMEGATDKGGETIIWRELPALAFTEVEDITFLDGHVGGPATQASFAFNLTGVPLYRYHRYIFSMQVRTPDHVSAWSMPSDPLNLMLPDMLPAPLEVESAKRRLPSDASVERMSMDEVVAEEAVSGEEAEGEADTPDPRKEIGLSDGVPIVADVCCEDSADAMSWVVRLHWDPFLFANNGVSRYPPLAPLPVEYQVLYYVISERPCAADRDSGGDVATGDQATLRDRELSSRFNGRACAEHDLDADRERDSAVVCCEGWIGPHERVVSRELSRHRLPHLRCDVRLFVACRCPCVTGPQWSKALLAVDVALPRFAELPLPTPRQLNCDELTAHGLAMDFGAAGADGRRREHIPADGFWAVVLIPAFPSEFVVVGADGVSAGGDRRDLLSFGEQGNPKAHYVLQFREYQPSSSQRGTGQAPIPEEPAWKTVTSVLRLGGTGHDSVYLASGFVADDSGSGSQGHRREKDVRWVILRLASNRCSHHSYSSPPALVTMLPSPTRPKVNVDWVDTPTLAGVRVRINARCHNLTKAYQIRFRLSSADPKQDASWTIREVQKLMPESLGTTGKSFNIEALALLKDFEYHSEYCFGFRTASPSRFSHWSEDSEPIRFSLEHHGMLPMLTAAGDPGRLQVELLGLEERHNYRCPTVQVTWPSLQFVEGAWGPESYSPSPSVTIEYRVRKRRLLPEHNDRVALQAAVEQMCEKTGHRAGTTKVCLNPDPDDDVRDVARRGYLGDCTKQADPTHQCTPWEVAAIVRAKVTSRNCTCMLSFFLEGFEYDLAVDWRWQRHGDPFWMTAYGPMRFTTATPVPVPPIPRPIRLLPEVWDQVQDLHALGSGHFLLLYWPFRQPPTSKIIPSEQERVILDEARHAPLEHGDYAVQCRPSRLQDSPGWVTCESRLLLVHGKPLCFVPSLPTLALLPSEPQGEDGNPKPIATKQLDLGAVGDDELEFRIVRAGDCEVSRGMVCAIAPPVPPAAVSLHLKMLPPHSTLVVCVQFYSTTALGLASLPREYQIRVEEIGGATRLLPPAQLPLERVPEAFAALRGHETFLGEAEQLQDKELFPEYRAARGGGEPQRIFQDLEFEHALAFRELNYGSRYRISVRWLSLWRVSEWSEPSDILVTIAPPSIASEARLEVKALEPLELPGSAVGDVFLHPVVGARAELAWPALSVITHGGGRMEYEVQRRCGLHDERGYHSGSRDMVASVWECAGTVLAGIDDPTGEGRPLPDSSGEGDGDGRLHFIAEDLPLSTWCQFRVRARLLFHPASESPGEWSLFLESPWHRTMSAVVEPAEPEEATVPDPPPPVLLERGTILLRFEDLPIREEQRPLGVDPPPAPYNLQFRGAELAATADWKPVVCEPLEGSGGFLVKDVRLRGHFAHGVVFRLWRGLPPEGGEMDSHCVDDDQRVRHFSGLCSQPSRPIAVECARFVKLPELALTFGPLAPVEPKVPVADELVVAIATADEHGTRPLLLQLDWAIVQPENPDLPAFRLHQVRYRPVEEGAQLLGVALGEGQPGPWTQLDAFEHVTTRRAPDVMVELPMGGPRFVFGSKHEVSIRAGTRERWGDWSPPLPFSLEMHPPVPPTPGEVNVQMVKLKDDTIFFHLTWPAFKPHHLCTMVEYRVHMQRFTRYKYKPRLSQEMVERSAESLEAQKELRVIGRVLKRLPRKRGPVGPPDEVMPPEIVEFHHRVAADAECGYTFYVDAKHERFDELRSAGGVGEVWSNCLESLEVLTPPLAKNFFIPTQVPLEVSPASKDRDRLRAPFPLAIGELTCERFSLADSKKHLIAMFAPWRTAKDASRWPHRVEYAPYIPRSNTSRLPIPGDEDENHVEWHLPGNVEYFYEDRDPTHELTVPLSCCALVTGFEMSHWLKEQARCGVPKTQMDTLGAFLRLRIVREGGPEGLQAFSAPSLPMRLYMPPIERAPGVTVWCIAGRPHALLWWPCAHAAAGEEDKNLDMSHQVHQIRMRRPLYEMDAGWVEGPVMNTNVPVLLPVGDDGTAALHAFAYCDLFDSSTMPNDLLAEPLPPQPLGCISEPAVLTYEFSVRVSDGYRWSEWSQPSDLCSFALEPKIVEDAPVDVDSLATILQPHSDTICPAEQITVGSDDLRTYVRRDEDGDIPPYWVAISKAAKPRLPPMAMTALQDAATNSQLGQFRVSWPNLPPQAYCQPDQNHMAVLEELTATNLVPTWVPPTVVYRLNVWLVESAADAAPMSDLPDGIMQDRVRTPPPGGDDDARAEKEALLYRQFDLPPGAFVEPQDGDYGVEPDLLTWVLSYLPPDRVYYCSVEGRFQTLTALEWWTPLMRSGEWTVERMPPPQPPEPMPICELPTPEYQKLIMRTAIGSTAIVALRWPWNIESKALDALRGSNYVLELCTSDSRPSLRDPTAKPCSVTGDTVFSRPRGPWLEPGSLQLCFANFTKGEVQYELPNAALTEPNWVPILVASGLPRAEGFGDEARFVHLRWRYRALPRDIALIPPLLHFSAASGPVRTGVVSPTMAPKWALECSPHSKRIVAWMLWVAWTGASKHQLAFRILSKPRKKRRRFRSTFHQSESSMSGTSEGSEGDMRATPDSTAQSRQSSIQGRVTLSRGRDGGLEFPLLEPQLVPITGWIELPPCSEQMEVQEVQPADDAAGDDDAEEPPRPEEKLLSEFKRKLPPAEWNKLLFRHYRDEDEYYSDKQRSETPASVQFSPTDSRASMAQEARSRQSMTPGSVTTTPLRSEDLSSIRRSTSKRKTQSHLKNFRMQFGMVVEWRVRVSDGFSWSLWSPPSSSGGLVPPIPAFPTPLHVQFSKRAPTVARIAWEACVLPAGYEHLQPSIEYVAYLTSDAESAKTIIQEGQAAMMVERLQRKGFFLSDGSCGVFCVLEAAAGEDGGQPTRPSQEAVEATSGGVTEHTLGRRGSGSKKADTARRQPPLDPNDFFTETSERRLVGKLTHGDAKLVNVERNGESVVVSGFELTVSGLKPESLHRFSIRARCATSGLDELDWQRLKAEPTHPLRWSEPHNSSPLLTPKMPPPLLVPKPIEIPEGRFARFRHTPCLLLSSTVFQKGHPDDFDKDHQVVLDIRKAGGTDEEYTTIPIEHSVYCEIEPYGPSRLVFNLPYLHGEIRARNTVMNDISAACPPFFALPPLPLEVDTGPKAELIVADDGSLFVQATWTLRLLEQQMVKLIQFSIKRHCVEAPALELEAMAFSTAAVLEEIPANAVVAAGEAYERMAAEVDQRMPPAPPLWDKRSPFLCRQCYRSLSLEAPSGDSLGPYGQKRLREPSASLDLETFPADKVPTTSAWGDNVRLLRVPHVAELDAARHFGVGDGVGTGARAGVDPSSGSLPQTVAEAKKLRKGPPVCGCRDLVVRKALPVDGHKICYGTTYRLRVRVKDDLTWSPWTDFCEPFPVLVPPPQPALVQKDPTKPVPPPMVDVILLDKKNGGVADPANAGKALTTEASDSDAHLRLRWPRFEGRLDDVEYRVLMWTLSPEQRRLAASRRLETKGKCVLPPVLGTHTFALTQGVAVQLEAPNEVHAAALNLGTAQPRALATAEELRKLSPRHGGADAPQVVAHVKPHEPAPRAGVLRRTGKVASAAAGRGSAVGEATAATVNAGAGAPAEKFVSVDVNVTTLAKGHGYVFAVEGKYSRGACGNAGEWSVPLFSKFVEFEITPTQLKVEVDARFGALLFKGNAVAGAKPKDEQVALDASAVHFVDEHKNLPKAMPLLPHSDAWPLNNPPGGMGKYVVRTVGRSVYADRHPVQGDEAGAEYPDAGHLPERRPHNDDLRQG